MSDASVEAIIREVDKNNDGQIQFEEFKNLMKALEPLDPA
jgi:Ca2+-binding EF-hand superfamily protein